MSELIRSGEFLNQIASDGESTLYPGRLKILIGSATCGIAAGARDVEEAALRAVKELGLDASISRTGCIGYCRNEPILDLMIPGSPRIGYGIMTPDKTRALLESYASSGDVKPDLAIYRYDQEIHTESGETHQYPASTNGVGSIPEISTIDFFRKQERVILRNCGSIDPMRIDEAVARGAYRGAFSAIAHKSPKEVIEEMKASGLRGRGGAGFLTGMKWDIASQSESDTKYIVCNGEEGDPGAFMDRCVLESDPHAVLEGMIVAAYAVGACEGFLYIRSEYRQAVATVEHAIREAEKTGLLGDDIFGSSFSFRIKVRQAAGAYVCGEETTLIASLEGHSGEPSIRPPYPVTEGMWKKPTVINNVKTLASIGPILSRGAEWYSSIGVENNRGTTVFSLVGAVKNTGLVEIPLGIPMREIVEEIGGGLPGKLPFKAIQTGGPLGGCLPESMLDLPVEYQKLNEAGTMMGSGFMIVIDEGTCILDFAKYFHTFSEEESCGKCVPCREGTQHLLRIINRICDGHGTLDDLALLERLAKTMRSASLCALGLTASNPVMAAIKYFREEVEAHIVDKKCPAGVCTNLITLRVDEAICDGCGECVKVCPSGAIQGKQKSPHRIDQVLCTHCCACKDVCPVEAVISE